MSRLRTCLFLLPPLVLLLTGRPAVGQPVRTDHEGDPLPAGALARLGTVRWRPGSHLFGVTFSPDGKTLASTAWDGTVRLWEFGTGRELRRFDSLKWPAGVAFSPDGKLLAAGDAAGDFSVRVWELATGKEVAHCRGHQLPVNSVAFHPEGHLLATGSWDGSVRVWQITSGQELSRLAGPRRGVNSIAYSPDGKFLAVGGRPNGSKDTDCTLYLWNLTGPTLRHLEGKQAEVTAVAFATGGLLTSTDTDGKFCSWDVGSGKELRELRELRGQGRNLAVSADGKTLAALADGRVEVWDMTTGKERSRFPVAGTGLDSLALSPDGRILVVESSTKSTLTLWDVGTGAKIRDHGGHEGPVQDLAFAPDGQTLASAGLDGTVRLWRAAGWEEDRCLAAGTDLLSSVGFAPDGVQVAAGGNHGTIFVWDLKGGLHHQWQSSGDWAFGVCFSPDGKLLASGSHDNLIRLRAAAGGQEVRQFTGHKGSVTTLAFMADGRTLISGSLDGTIRLWETATGHEVRLLRHEGGVWKIALAPNGQLLASAGADGTIRLWELITGQELCCFGKHTPPAYAVAFAPDGRTVASGGEDATLRLWEVLTGKERQRFQGHQGVIRAIAFAPDGRTVVSGSEDTSLLVWDVTGLRTEENPLAGGQVEPLWKDLAGEDAARAHQALWALTSMPEKNVAFLRQQVRPVPPVQPGRLPRLVAELDADDFDVREKATAELAELGELAAPALRDILIGAPSAEQRRRAERLLAGLTSRFPAPPQVGRLRAVEVLEAIHSPFAREVLQGLAEGAAEARLTREARAALQRLDRRARSTP